MRKGMGRNRVLATCAAAACAIAIAFGAMGGVASDGGGAVDSACDGASAVRATTAKVAKVPSRPELYEPGQLVVGLAPGSDVDAVMASLGELGFGRIEALLREADGFGAIISASTSAGVEQGADLAAEAQSAAAIPGVEFVQPNYRYASAGAKAADVARDEDVQAGMQYYLDSAGVPATWDKTDPAVKVDVAVLDTGVYSMEEYDKGTLVTANPDNFHQEFDADNLDMAAGADFVHSGAGERLPLVNDYNPTGDDNGHGTHIAGIIAANAQTDATPNKRADGMAGVSANARIVPIKVLDAGGDGDVNDFIRAYNYLLSDEFMSGHNLHVINMSLAVALEEEDTGEVGKAVKPGLRAASTEEGESADDEGAEGADDAGGAHVGARLGETGEQRAFDGPDAPRVASADNGASAEPDSGAQASSANAKTATGKAKAQVQTQTSTEIGAASAEDPVDGSHEFYDAALHSAIKRAQSKGIVTVCSAGNMEEAEDPEDTLDRDSETYPSDYPECVSVMALDEDDKIATYSYVNSNKDIAAPGSGIYSAWATQADAYRELDGTSQATAIVSGVMSMMWAAEPDLTVQQAKSALYGATEGASGAERALNAEATLDRVKAGDYKDWIDSEWHKPVNFDNADVEVAADELVYTGKHLTPTVKVTYGSRTLKNGSDYTVAYAGNVNPGTAKVIVKGKGRFVGSQTDEFDIVLGKTKIKKLKKGKKSFTVKWQRQKVGKVGYQVRYSLKKNMKKAKTKTVKKNAKTKLKVKKLKSNKRYYVQVRTFKKIAGKKYYSAWSQKKTVKVR